MKMEKMTVQLIDMIHQALGPVQSTVVGLADTDIFAGAGVLGPRAKCIWRNDGHRITFEALDHGGFIASVSKEPDPEYPGVKAKKHKGKACC